MADRSEVQRQIDAIGWYHDIDFPNGLTARTKSPDADSHRALWAFMRGHLDRIDFGGKAVLDIGCWDGYWSFYAEKRGAKRVLATDDATQNWAGAAGLQLAKGLLNSSIETRADVSVYELDGIAEKFDLILFMGVYYHLVDPFFALSQLRHRCHDGALLIVEGDILPWTPLGDPPIAHFELGHPVRCFVPTSPCLKQMLAAAYFEVMSESVYYGLPTQLLSRAFIVCRAITGENRHHPTVPPFGLARYDPRYLR